MPAYERDLPSLRFEDHGEWDRYPGYVNEEAIDPWTFERTATSSGTSTPDLVPDNRELAGERLFFSGDDETGRLSAIEHLLDNATAETRRAVSASLRSRDSRDSDSQVSLGRTTRSFGRHLAAMESVQALTQQAHPDGQTFYRCRIYSPDVMQKLLEHQDLESGDVQHLRPHDWLIVPTWLKVKQLRGEGSKEEVEDLNRDFQAKFNHGVNTLMVQLQAAREGEDCACHRWCTYPELKDLTGLEIVCKIQIDAIVFKCLAHFYDDNAKELPGQIEGILSCTELKERNKHLYGNPA